MIFIHGVGWLHGTVCNVDHYAKKQLVYYYCTNYRKTISFFLAKHMSKVSDKISFY